MCPSRARRFPIVGNGLAGVPTERRERSRFGRESGCHVAGSPRLAGSREIEPRNWRKIRKATETHAEMADFSLSFLACDGLGSPGQNAVSALFRAFSGRPTESMHRLALRAHDETVASCCECGRRPFRVLLNQSQSGVTQTLPKIVLPVLCRSSQACCIRAATPFSAAFR